MGEFKSDNPKTAWVLASTATPAQVKNNILVNTITQIMNAHIESGKIRPESADTWQGAFWKQHFEQKSTYYLGEFILNGAVYGEAICELVVSVDTQGKRIIKDVIPLEMNAVTRKRVDYAKPDTDITAYEVYYYNKPMDVKYLRQLVFYTEGGAPYPFGRKIANDVKRYETAKELQSFGVSRAIAGQYYGVGDGNTEALVQFFADIRDNAYAGSELNGWEIKEVPQSTSKAEIAQTTDTIIRNAEQAVYNAFCMGWMLTSQTTPGTYGAMQAHLDAYSKYVNHWGNVIKGFYNELAQYVARINFEEPVKIVMDEIRIGKNESSGYTPYEVKALLDGNLLELNEARKLLGFGEATQGLVDRRNSLAAALSPPAQAKEETLQTPEALADWLGKDKKQQMVRKLKDAVERKLAGSGVQYDFDQRDKLEKMTGRKLDMPVAKFELAARELVRSIAKGKASPNEFDSIWNTFMEEVLNG